MIAVDKAVTMLREQARKVDTLQDASVSHPAFIKWERDTSIIVERIFGNDSRHLSEFNNVRFKARVIRSTIEAVQQAPGYFAKGRNEAQALLNSMADELENFGHPDATQDQSSDAHPILAPAQNSKIVQVEALQTRLRSGEFRSSQRESSEVMGALAGLLADEGYHDAMLEAGHVFSAGVSSARMDSTWHQVDQMVTAALIRMKNPSASNPKSATAGSKIFIGHGGSLQWMKLSNYLKDRLGLQWEEFNRVSAAGFTTTERIERMLDECGFAFLVMTAEDEQKDGDLHARQNVVHEAGLFQGRLGFKRAIILIEDGCSEFSNIKGLTQIPFPKGRISACFHDVLEVLEREGFLTAPSKVN